MVFKKQLFLPLTFLLLTPTQTTPIESISASYLHTSTLQVAAFFAVTGAIIKLMCPDLGRQNKLEGRHNPDHDTAYGGSFYGAKCGSVLGAVSRFFICPSQLKSQVTPCTCSLDTDWASGLAWTATGAALGTLIGYVRSTLFSEKHNLECAEELLVLTPYEHKLVNLALELSTTDSNEMYKKISSLHCNSDYPLVYCHCDFNSIRTRFLRIETYLHRALNNEELDHHEIALIGELMQNTKKILSSVDEMLIFISNNQVFSNQLVAQKQVIALNNIR